MKMTDILKEKRFEVTLKETSYDKANKEYMCDLSCAAIDFDCLKDQFVRSFDLRNVSAPSSNDALIVKDDEYIFIEFKNGHINPKIAFEIQKKIYDSFIILSDLCDEVLSDLKKKTSFILVYNGDKNDGHLLEGFNISTRKKGKTHERENSRNEIVNTLFGLANERLIRFNLEIFLDYLFKDVYTLTLEEFVEEYQDLL